MNNPEISDVDATGETARIFAEIKAAFGMSMVNQIYRRLAAVPGGLEWAWPLVRTAMDAGTLETSARRLVGAIRFDEPAPGFADEMARLFANADLRAEVTTVLDAYNRSNPMNLIAVNLLRDALKSGRPSYRPPPLTGSNADMAIFELPPLVDIDAVGPDLHNSFLRLARHASGGDTTIIPTLFRHLGRWPAFLELAADGIDTVVESGVLSTVAKDLETEASTHAGRLATKAPDGTVSMPAPVGQNAEAIGRLFEGFSPAISGMIVIGAWLRRQIPT